jgi:hypothetical protein
MYSMLGFAVAQSKNLMHSKVYYAIQIMLGQFSTLWIFSYG